MHNLFCSRTLRDHEKNRLNMVAFALKPNRSYLPDEHADHQRPSVAISNHLPNFHDCSTQLPTERHNL
jgi:hypothetical protein